MPALTRLSLVTRPSKWPAGGVASYVSRSLSAVVDCAIGADDIHGQCDSSVGPASVGPTTPSAKEPPMGYATPAAIRHQENSTTFADSCAVIGCANCGPRYLR